MDLVRIPTKELDKVWSLIEKDIKNALAYSSHQDNNNKYFGVVVTEIIKRKLGKVCHIYIMTGRQRHKWQYLIKDIEEFAKKEDCQMMELIARPGWQKVLNNFGYKKTHVVLEKKIKKEESK
jgi:hypothetical protein